MTAMDYRQYDNALGRFNSIDALSEMNYSVSPFAFSYNNPIFWSDPTGLLSQAFVNSLLQNSAENSATKWINDGGGTFSKQDGSGMADQETGEFTGFDSLRAITVTGRKTSGGGSHLEGNIGGLAQSKAYSFGRFYENWRSDFRTKQFDDTQDFLSGLGTADPTGAIDGINALGYLLRGQTGNAAIAAIAIIPYVGDAAKGIKLGYKGISIATRSALAARIGKRGYTEVGYQFSKHAGRVNGSAWKSIIPIGTTLNPNAWNKYGYDVYKEIMRSPGSIEKVGGFLEKRLPDGRGIRLQDDFKFKGFLD